jgi:hypothetical protein
MQSVKDILDSSSPESLRAEAERSKAKREELANEKPLPTVPTIRGMIEITRSFSYKLNVGNYESRDFFCSEKVSCYPEEAEAIAKTVHEFCQAQVIHSVGAYMKARDAQRTKGEC